MRFGLKVNAGTWSEAQQWAGIAEEVCFDGGDAWVTFPGPATEDEFGAATLERTRTLDRLCRERDRAPASLRRILLAYGAITPWSSADDFARMVDRYRELGFDEIVCYAPKPEERAVFDKVVAGLTSM